MADLADEVERLREALTDTVAALGGCARPMSKEPCGTCVVCRADRALGGTADLTDRVAELRAWARSRIEHCRAQEQKFGAAGTVRRSGVSLALIEATQERRTLQAVMGILEGDNG